MQFAKSSDAPAVMSRVATLFERHAHEAKRLAYLLTGDLPLSEDLAQDAFLKACARLAHLRDPDKFPAYLRKTVLNLVRMHYRRAAMRPLGEAYGAAAEHLDLDAAIDVRAALSMLSHRQRAAIVLRYFAQCSDEETADLLRCRRATVRSLIARGLERMKQALEAGHG